MEYNGILYKHIHPRLIDKELFDLCQDIKHGRGHNKYKRTQDDFILKGLIKCLHCECSFSPYIKKGHTYIRPNNAKTNCKYCKNINENKVLSQLKNAIQDISIPSDILFEIKDALKKSIEVEYKEYSTIIEQLNLELKNIKTKTYNWNLRCAEDLSITAEERIELLKPLRKRQDEIEVELNQLQQADKKFEMTLDVMLDLASKSYTLFESSRNTEKREILKLLFSNLTLNGENIDYTYTKPFNLFVNLEKSQQWSG
jgi:site-specific DNA recombinase